MPDITDIWHATFEKIQSHLRSEMITFLYQIFFEVNDLVLTNTVYHESFKAEKFRGFLLLRETFFHEKFQLLLKSGRL